MTTARQKLERKLPALRSSAYAVIGTGTRRYNCIGWAAGTDAAWWDPFEENVYWPDGVLRHDGLSSVMAALATAGYAPCDDATLEDGIQKIAFYAIDGFFKHVAVQLADGRWSSKLGPDELIEHDELDALASHANVGGAWQYGEVVAFMSRAREG